MIMTMTMNKCVLPMPEKGDRKRRYLKSTKRQEDDDEDILLKI